MAILSHNLIEAGMGEPFPAHGFHVPLKTALDDPFVTSDVTQ
jgi:hypothetical protein